MTAEQKEILTKMIKDSIAACTALRDGTRERYEAAMEKIDHELELATTKYDKDERALEIRKSLLDETEEHLHEFSIKCTKTKTWMNELFAAMRKNQDISKKIYERDMRVMKERKKVLESSVEEKKKLGKSEYDLTARRRGRCRVCLGVWRRR